MPPFLIPEEEFSSHSRCCSKTSTISKLGRRHTTYTLPVCASPIAKVRPAPPRKLPNRDCCVDEGLTMSVPFTRMRVGDQRQVIYEELRNIKETVNDNRNALTQLISQIEVVEENQNHFHQEQKRYFEETLEELIKNLQANVTKLQEKENRYSWSSILEFVFNITHFILGLLPLTGRRAKINIFWLIVLLLICDVWMIIRCTGIKFVYDYIGTLMKTPEPHACPSNVTSNL